jgi:hypothetical protein
VEQRGDHQRADDRARQRQQGHRRQALAQRLLVHVEAGLEEERWQEDQQDDLRRQLEGRANPEDAEQQADDDQQRGVREIHPPHEDRREDYHQQAAYDGALDRQPRHRLQIPYSTSS